MSFSNILADENDTKASIPLSPTSARKAPHTPAFSHQSSPDPPRLEAPPGLSPTRSRHSTLNLDRPMHEWVPEQSPKHRSISQKIHARKPSVIDKYRPTPTQAYFPKPKVAISEKEFQAAFNKLENMEMSEPDDTAFEAHRQLYQQRQLKRWAGLEELEARKRKVSIPT